MEAATAAQPPAPDAPAEEPEAPTPVETSPAENRSAEVLFRYSDWVHVGPGANECENAYDGECNNELHFHAWVRLPNQFQHASIAEKAQAAMARRSRQYRDPESDASIILDDKLEAVMQLPEEDAKSAFIDEIAGKDFMRDLFDVQSEMIATEEWATIQEDRERLELLERMDADERDDDEYKELTTHVAAFHEEVERKVREEKQQPVREALADRTLDDLRKLVREDRVSRDANAHYIKTYTVWEQYIGTLRIKTPKKLGDQQKGIPQQRVFASVEDLKAAAPEIIRALDEAFESLDGELGRNLPNSPGKGL